MAHSIIEFRNKDFRVHDLDLAMACFLIMKQSNGSLSDTLQKLFDDWLESISFDGPGCIDLHLDEHLVESDHINELISLINLAESELKEYSVSYPKIELTQYLDKAKINLIEDYKVDLIENVLKGFRSIIE